VPHAGPAGLRLTRRAPANQAARAEFDVNGPSGPHTRVRRPPGAPQPADVDELFRAFFGGGVPFAGFHAGPGFHSQTFHQGRPMGRRPPPPPPPEEGLAGVLRQLMPLLLLAVLLLPGLLSDGLRAPPYSLSRTADHSSPARTAVRGVPFFVASPAAFAQRFPPASYAGARAEEEVEELYSQRLASRCRRDVATDPRPGRSVAERAADSAACAELTQKFPDKWVIR
jgi:hypothetical protein